MFYLTKTVSSPGYGNVTGMRKLELPVSKAQPPVLAVAIVCELQVAADVTGAARCDIPAV